MYVHSSELISKEKVDKWGRDLSTIISLTICSLIFYSTASPEVAEQYATPFKYNGNRINPEYTREVDEPGVGMYYITSDKIKML